MSRVYLHSRQLTGYHRRIWQDYELRHGTGSVPNRLHRIVARMALLSDCGPSLTMSSNGSQVRTVPYELGPVPLCVATSCHDVVFVPFPCSDKSPSRFWS